MEAEDFPHRPLPPRRRGASTVSDLRDDVEEGEGVVFEGVKDLEIGFGADGVVLCAPEAGDSLQVDAGGLDGETMKLRAHARGAGGGSSLIVEDGDHALTGGELGNDGCCIQVPQQGDIPRQADRA